MLSGVYCIRNRMTGKVYVGSTSRPIPKRWGAHISELNRKVHYSKSLQSDWDTCGIFVFDFILLEFCEKESLKPREQFWMDHYKCYDADKGYNVSKIAYASPPPSKETLEKARLANLGRKMPEHVREAIDKINVGRKDTPEQRERKSVAHKGRIITWGDKISASRKGKPLSEEHKKALSEAAKRRKPRKKKEVDTVG